MIAIINPMDFYDWIKKKYSDWSGGKKSENQFAVYIGISQATLNAWMNKTRGIPTSKKIINKLVERYGDEVYDVLGLTRPDIRDLLIEMRFPIDFVDALIETRNEYTRELESKGITTDTPEARRIVNEALAKLAAQFAEVENLSKDKSS